MGEDRKRRRRVGRRGEARREKEREHTLSTLLESPPSASSWHRRGVWARAGGAAAQEEEEKEQRERCSPSRSPSLSLCLPICVKVWLKWSSHKRQMSVMGLNDGREGGETTAGICESELVFWQRLTWLETTEELMPMSQMIFMFIEESRLKKRRRCRNSQY